MYIVMHNVIEHTPVILNEYLNKILSENRLISFLRDDHKNISHVKENTLFSLVISCHRGFL